MAKKQTEDLRVKIKRRMTQEVNGIGDSADLLVGKKELGGKKKFKTKEEAKKSKKGQPEELSDFDRFLQEVEKGFVGTTKEKDTPYQGMLGKVKVERLVKGTHK